MIPEFDPTTGCLPNGEWDATWKEFVLKFNTNAHRAKLTTQLFAGLQVLKVAGCKQVWVNGSFTTEKINPGDVDVLYDVQGIRPADLPKTFQDKAGRRSFYGGDYIPVDLANHQLAFPTGLFAFFRGVRDSSTKKGIVRIRLNTLPPVFS